MTTTTTTSALKKYQKEQIKTLILTCLEFGPNTRSKAKVLVILSTALSLTTTSRSLGQSTMLRDFILFSSAFRGLKIQETLSVT
jgi:hypothetical protein